MDAVTMRGVAAQGPDHRDGAVPACQEQGDLLDGLVGRLLTELSLPDPTKPWPDRLREIARSAREAAHRHPAVMPLLFARRAVTVDAVRVVDAIYQALLDAGVSDGEVARVERLTSTFVLGYAISEASGRFTVGDSRERRAALASADLPAHREAGGETGAAGLVGRPSSKHPR